ncbi:MAG: GAF domain-containing protein [Anaerolineae bacterium]|nr:GAF domain-containing protein [Anaerolineae bacterium]
MSTSTSQLIRFLQHENARLSDDNDKLREENRVMKQYVDALTELYWATKQITTEENLMNLLYQILDNGLSILNAEGGSLALLDTDTDELEFVVVRGGLGDKLVGYRIKGDAGIAGWVATHREPLIVNNPRQDNRFLVQVDETFDFFTHSILCVPLITGSKLIGVIQLLNKRDNSEFTDTDVVLLSILSHVAATALEEMRLELEAQDATLAAVPA